MRCGAMVQVTHWQTRVRNVMIKFERIAEAILQGGALLAQEPSIESVNSNNGFLEILIKPGVEDYSFVPARLIQAGYKLTMMREEEVNLETAFMRLTKGLVQ